MATQLLNAKRGNITDEMEFVADIEEIDVRILRENIAQGTSVILKNNTRTITNPTGIGEGLKIKIAASVGTTTKKATLDKELDKVRVIEQAGADVLFDFSTGNLIDETRQAILSSTKLPLGVNPLLQIAINQNKNKRGIFELSKDEVLSTIEKICMDGVDFLALDCASTKAMFEQLKMQKRKSGIVTQSGLILADFIHHTQKENPIYEYFDEILEIIKPYDMTLLISNTFKTGCMADSGDKISVIEAVMQGEMADKARKYGIQVMIENIGHIKPNEIENEIKLIKKLTKNAPLYTKTMTAENTIGFDNINSAISSAIAGMYGANMINCTPTYENASCMTSTQAKESIVCAKISANCADLANNNIKAKRLNSESIKAMNEKDWQKQIKNSVDNSSSDTIKEQYKLPDYFSTKENSEILKNFIEE